MLFLRLLSLVLVLCMTALSDASGPRSVTRLPLRRVKRQNLEQPPRVDPRLRTGLAGADLVHTERGGNMDYRMVSASQGQWSQEMAIHGPRPYLELAGTLHRKLNNLMDMIYLIDVAVGTPAKSQQLVLDTGSSDLWVAPKASGSTIVQWLTGKAPAGAPNSYDPKKSQTSATTPHDNDTIHYGMGIISGPEILDTVCLGEVCLTKQTLIFAKSVQDLPSLNFDGILGVAFPALASSHGSTFLEQLAAGGKYTHLAFGLQIAKTDTASSFVIGDLKDVLDAAPPGYQRSEAVSCPVLAIESLAISLLPVPAYWMVSTDVSVEGSGEEQGLHLGLRNVAVDSGTSLIAVPTSDFKVIQSAVNKSNPTLCFDATTLLSSLPAGLTICYCNATVPTLNFKMAGSAAPSGLLASLEATKHVSIAIESSDLLQDAGMSDRDGQPFCSLGIMEGPATIPIWILGDVFLRKAGYVVHDVENVQVIFYPPAIDLEAIIEHDSITVDSIVEQKSPALLIGVSLCLALFGFLFWPRSAARVAPECEGAYTRL